MDTDDQAARIAELQGEIENLQIAAAASTAAVATTAAANAAALAAAGPANGPPAAPVFTLAPALASTAVFLDLASVSGTKHFKGATEPLNKQPFDFADSSDLQVFLDLVLKKSQVWGWNTIFTVPVTNHSTGITTNHNLLEEYGVIPLASVRAHTMTYYATQSKQAQDSFMACQCLLSSLTLEFLKLITSESSDYHLPSIVASQGPVPAGPLLLKLIISQAHVDSRATVSHIRTSLTLLDSKMIELDSNIETFNQYVKSQIKNLLARGETSSDLLINLFKGYKVANDVEFLDFIRRKENSYEEGEDVNPNNLMADALVKYKARKLTDKWSAPTKEQGQILALTAKVDLLKISNKTQKANSATPGKPSGAKKDKNKWAWKNVLPKGDDPVTKDFEGRKYHIACKYHPKQWVCHSESECSKNPTNAGKSPAADRHLPKAKINQALSDEEEDSAEESQDDDY
jgi:hypothetical protein